MQSNTSSNEPSIKQESSPVLATMHHAPSSSSTHDSSTRRSSAKMTISSPTTTSSASPLLIPLPLRMTLSALAGMSAATVCHPLDVIRVHLQTSSVGAKGQASGWQAARSIYANAGVSGLYAGISAAYLRQWLYGSCRMGIYSYLLEYQKNKTGDAPISFATKLGMGCISGGIGSFVGTPSEVALVRMSADQKLPLAERRNYTNVLNCLSRIAMEEGPTQLWRGAAPTVARATLLSSASLGVTSQAKISLGELGYFHDKHGQEWLGGLPLMLCATLLSSFCANLVSNPFDVVKSRMQQMKIVHGQPPMYTSMLDCFVKSIRQEGPLVVYKGFTPAFLKLAPYSIIALTVADKLTKAVTGKDAL